MKRVPGINQLKSPYSTLCKRKCIDHNTIFISSKKRNFLRKIVININHLFFGCPFLIFGLCLANKTYSRNPVRVATEGGYRERGRESKMESSGDSNADSYTYMYNESKSKIS